MTDINIEGAAITKKSIDPIGAKQQVTQKPLIHLSSLQLRNISRELDERFYNLNRDLSYFNNVFFTMGIKKTGSAFALQEEDSAYPSTVYGCVIRRPTLNVYVLQSALDFPFHGGDNSVFLEDPVTKAYIGLSGERSKNSYHHLDALALPTTQNPVDIACKTFADPWTEFSTDLKDKCENNSLAYRDALVELMEPLDLTSFTKNFLLPNFDPGEINNYVQGPVRTSLIKSEYAQKNGGPS
ncbi:MAG: hypothetical protein PHW76_10225 [Alphaproteobacteria bacterium]|nr:hypothetical protein [Alphaproteobacteria bacterium]